MRYFFYSHDGMGLGHVRRQIAIATALNQAAPQVHILLATSADEVTNLGLPPNVETLKLPGLRKVANTEYSSRRLGLPKRQIHRLRAGILLEAVKGFAPDVLLVDKHPFGAGGELEPALHAAKSRRAKLVLGLRDILDDPSAVKKEWDREKVQQRLCEYFDLVLIYGLRAVFDPIQAYELSSEIASRSRYCGYVVNHGQSAWWSPEYLKLKGGISDVRPTVLCTVGGGEDGFGLLRTFAQACDDGDWRGVAITGPMLPEAERLRLEKIVSQSEVTLQSFVPCLSLLFGSMDAIVCMGGYNTLLEALSKGVPTVCVPRTTPRSEQIMRGLAFERLGLLRVITPKQLSASALKAAISAALKTERRELKERSSAALSFEGASVAARYLLASRAAMRRARNGVHEDQQTEVCAAA